MKPIEAGTRPIAVLALLVIGVAGCSKPPPEDTSVWTQKTEIKLANADFRACVTAAVAKTPGLSVDETATTADGVRVLTPLAGKIKGLRSEVRRSDHGTADIQFIGSGAREPDEVRRSIAPLLRQLGEAVAAACGSGA